MPIGTAAAIGIGVAAAGTTGSFLQASKQRKKQSEAEAEAEKAMQEAKKKLEINFYKGLSINKEPYELAREASLVSGAGLIQAGTESERGAGAVAGRVQMAQNQNQGEIRTAMGNEMQDLNKLVATEDANLNRLGINLDLASVEGAQLAAANYETMANNSLTQGIQGVSNIGGQVLAAAPLYAKNNAEKQMRGLEDAYNAQITNGTLDPHYMVNGQPMPFNQALMLKTGSTGMNPVMFNNYMLGQDKTFYKGLYDSGFQQQPVNLPPDPTMQIPTDQYNYKGVQLGQNKGYNNWNFGGVTY